VIKIHLEIGKSVQEKPLLFLEIEISAQNTASSLVLAGGKFRTLKCIVACCVVLISKEILPNFKLSEKVLEMLPHGSSVVTQFRGHSRHC
jgi:hypothetical protein